VKLIMAVYVLVLGWMTHDVVTNLPTPAVEIVEPMRGHVYDPRPYLPAPTSTTTTTIVVEAFTTRYEDRCPEWRPLVESLGVRSDEIAYVMRIIYRESRCNPKSVNSTLNRDGSIDYGLAQVNDRTWCLPTKYAKRGWLQQQRIVETCADLLDAETNLRAMVALMDYSRERTGCAFTPWLLCDEWRESRDE